VTLQQTSESSGMPSHVLVQTLCAAPCSVATGSRQREQTRCNTHQRINLCQGLSIGLKCEL